MSPCPEGGSIPFRALAGAAWLLVAVAGCSYHPGVCGLRPFSPDVVATTTGDSLVFAEVDSLQPILRWEAFPRPSDLRSDRHGLLARTRAVTYELMIWREEDDGSMKKVYERKGLPVPGHRVEELLEPASRYSWSVRAKFLAGDEERVIPWGFSKVPPIPGLTFCIAPRNVPNQNTYRFRTPAK